MGLTPQGAVSGQRPRKPRAPSEQAARHLEEHPLPSRDCQHHAAPENDRHGETGMAGSFLSSFGNGASLLML